MTRLWAWVCSRAQEYATQFGVLCLVLAVVWLAGSWYFRPVPPGGLTKQKTHQVAARRDSVNRASQRDTARAHRALASAKTTYAIGRRAETNAALLHAQTHVIHRPLPPGADSAAVADSLTRILAAY